jgi:hypothetical protein
MMGLLSLNLYKYSPLGQMTSHMNFQFDLFHHMATRWQKQNTKCTQDSYLLTGSSPYSYHEYI